MTEDFANRRQARSLARVGMALACLLLLWGLIRSSGTPSREHLLVRYVGLTNDVGGRIVARFDITNQGTRLIRFGVGSPQLRAATGWPPPDDLGGGTGDWLSVAAGSSQAVWQPPPSTSGHPWRLPLIYEEDPPAWRRFLDGILGRRWLRSRSQFTVSPPVAGLSSDPAQAHANPIDSVTIDQPTRRR